ncbi:TIGR04290 family methyltransferase [Geomonas sp. RF6]|uniref:TIGR04290 family methyltransferase n=1 Tax=Geomonas sp. RF6 TaxID=2897342 RepID=UPI001E29EBF6|nr:TIGR04290 family methyltransferase [Geomonas sp. RF6]UFS72149.1 TIGR04290 family methyltransferase [Geomonas sp. RF6]
MDEAYKKTITEKIAALSPWFHNLHLPGGIQTAADHFLGDFPMFKWVELAPFVPEDLTGWTALDIGCNAGFYTFELARRGAQVTGIDIDPHYLEQAQWVAQLLGLQDRVTLRRMQVYELAREKKNYDLVLFMGVFYHLRYPLLALDIVAQKVQKMMIFQTMTMPGREVYEQYDEWINERDALLHQGWPKVAFIEHRFAGDPTNWWIPNHAAVEALLRSAGMRITGYPGHEIYRCEPNPERPSCVATWNRSEYLCAVNAKEDQGRDQEGMPLEVIPSQPDPH